MKLVYTGKFFAGSYSEKSGAGITTEADCTARCETRSDCVAVTWVARPSDPCVLYTHITAKLDTYAAVRNWVKLPGRFVKANNTGACAIVGFPEGCTWWEEFSDSSIHFVSNCDDFPRDCHPQQLPCWGQPLAPLDEITAAELVALKRDPGDNYTCAMNPLPIVPPSPGPRAMRPAEMLRTQFHLPGDRVISAATAFVGGVGWTELYVNGVAAGAHDKLNPGRTEFDRRLFYLAYDVTALVQPGANSMGVWLGHGWMSMQERQATAIAYLRVLLDNGTAVDVVSSNETWTATRGGPVVDNDIYIGETYDARLEVPGWSTTNSTQQWPPASALDQFAAFNYSLRWQPMPPIRALQLNSALSLTPVSLSSGEVVHVYEFGQNAAGWAQLRLSDCPAGTNITMWYSEVLCGYGTTRWSPPCPAGQPPGEGRFGTVDQRNYRGSWRDIYTCAGHSGGEVYEPRFTYRGHRFVEIHGFPGTPSLQSVAQRVVHSDVEAVLDGLPSVGDVEARTPTGRLRFGGSDHGLLNNISHNVRWTLIDNLHSVPEDCDNRNERWGWMADASVSAEADVHYNWMPALYTSWLDSMRNVQTDPTANCAAATGADGDTNVVDGTPDCHGSVGDLTPGRTPADLPGDPSWMFAYPLVYSYVFRYYGDADLAARLFPGIQEYVDWQLRMANSSKTGLLSWFKYGDWLEPGKVRSEDIIGAMSSAFNMIQSVRIAAQAAGALGNTALSDRYAEIDARLTKSFHAKFFTNDTRFYGDGTQPSLVYALWLGAAPGELEAAVFARLVELIHEGTSQCSTTPCLDTGILATKWLMETLSRHNRTDLALELALKTDYPSWG